MQVQSHGKALFHTYLLWLISAVALAALGSALWLATALVRRVAVVGGSVVVSARSSVAGRFLGLWI